jgi:hypothetical protein
MKLLVLVLNKTDILDDLLRDLLATGVRGATIIDSTGMARAIDIGDVSICGSLRMVIAEDRQSSKTLLIAVQDSLVDQVRATIDNAVGGLSKPDTGVLFGLPIISSTER